MAGGIAATPCEPSTSDIWCEECRRAPAIVTSVHQLTRALNVGVVAEGVEDQRTADALAALPGIIAQGWHFGRPMTAEDLHDWRQRRNIDDGEHR